MGISIAVVGSTEEAVLQSLITNRSGVLLIPTLAWTLALAMVPNKWLGYAVTTTVIVGLSAYVLLCIRVDAVPFRRARVASLLMLTILSTASTLNTLGFYAPPTHKPVMDALHEAIPQGNRILVPAREWHALDVTKPSG